MKQANMDLLYGLQSVCRHLYSIYLSQLSVTFIVNGLKSVNIEAKCNYL